MLKRVQCLLFYRDDKDKDHYKDKDESSQTILAEFIVHSRGPFQCLRSCSKCLEDFVFKHCILIFCRTMNLPCVLNL